MPLRGDQGAGDHRRQLVEVSGPIALAEPPKRRLRRSQARRARAPRRAVRRSPRRSPGSPRDARLKRRQRNHQSGKSMAERGKQLGTSGTLVGLCEQSDGNRSAARGMRLRCSSATAALGRPRSVARSARRRGSRGRHPDRRRALSATCSSISAGPAHRLADRYEPARIAFCVQGSTDFIRTRAGTTEQPDRMVHPTCSRDSGDRIGSQKRRLQSVGRTPGLRSIVTIRGQRRYPTPRSGEPRRCGNVRRRSTDVLEPHMVSSALQSQRALMSGNVAGSDDGVSKAH